VRNVGLGRLSDGVGEVEEGEGRKGEGVAEADEGWGL
jgi:hypothetical protein